MTKNINIRTASIMLLIMLALLLFSSCADSRSDAESAEKFTRLTYALWPAYTFEEAIDTAVTIVYGTVSAKSDTQEHYADCSDGSVYTEYYKNVTVDVIECLKGDTGAKTVNYVEMGGEDKTTVYVYSGIEIVSVGDTVLLFLDDDGSCISPYAFFTENADNNTTVSNDMLPISAYADTESLTQSVNMDDYLSMIRAELEK